MLCKLNRDCLKDIFKSDFHILELESRRPRGAADFLFAFRGYIDGVTEQAVDDAARRIRDEKIDCVFIDGSNLGEIAASLRRRGVAVKVVTFFHNVEARFFLGALRDSGSLRALAVLTANYLAERKAVRDSDAIIAMTEHDSALLRKLYGRGATAISAMALEDKYHSPTPTPIANATPSHADRFIIFVGGAFYANRSGIEWFIENVAPRIGIRTIVVGRGLESLRRSGIADNKVEVIGAVDDLAPWYAEAHCVIAPIFDGSGMKTKVAEALMFGKKVVGTPEAFRGYEADVFKAGWICRTADEFVATIQNVCSTNIESFNSEARALFERTYSRAAARSRYATILTQLTT